MILKKYKEFINESKQTILRRSMIIRDKHVKDGKLDIKKYDIVNGNFTIKTLLLTSLEGCPREVGGNFYSEDNNLVTLEGGPEKVGGNFYCSYNRLTSLEGGPKKVGGSYHCNHNQLTSLEGGPKQAFNWIHTFCSGSNKFNLKIEEEFIISGNYKNDYWIDLLNWMVSNNKDVNLVKGWPEGFLDSNMGRNAKKIGKFGI